MSGLAPYTPSSAAPFDRAAAAHLFRRAGFGAGRETIERALEEGFEASLQRLLEPPGHDPRLLEGIERLLAAGSIEHLQAWWMALMLANGDPLRERMTLLWHDHFATSHDKVQDVRLMHGQNRLLREQGLGSFRALLHALAKDPAMLVWLDGDSNRRGRPNENFARELLELFALGLGPSAARHYDERDVQEAARAFTGWGTAGRAFRWKPEDHDPGHKRVLGLEGALSGEEVIERVLDHPACARHVARRLLQELVAPEPEPAEVEALAAFLVEADWSVRAAVEHVLRSALFHAPATRRSRISSPVELVVGTALLLGARVAPLVAARAAGRMGQSLFRPPSVKGWDGDEAWIDAGTWLARHDALLRLACAELERAEGFEVDLRASLGSPEREHIVGRALELLLPEGVPSAFQATLQDALEQQPDERRALATVVALILTAPEHHLA